MALPPNPGEDDPLGGMDPMAWLESLAKRQGASPDELTTKADLDVPLPTGDYKIDEPGYTPGYDTGATKPVKAEAKPVSPAPPVPVTPPPAPEPAQPEPVASVSDDPLGGMDPMAWLESLAKRQGANADELTTTADLDVPLPTGDYVIDEPGYTPGYDLPKSAKEEPKQPEPVKAAAPPPPPPAPEPEPVISEPVASVSDDPLGGMDPMAWLESLAKRQGANADELTTTADLDVPLPTGDYVIDEPGYTPGYELPKTAKEEPKQPEPVKAAAPPPPPPAPEPEPVISEPVASVSDDPLGGMDPMAWLESLAKRQGANADELTTTADLDVPLPTGDYVIDEPGYTPGYDLPKTAKEEPKQPEPVKAAAPPPPPPAPEPEPVISEPAAELDPMADPMAWLESLAKRQGANADELTTTADIDVPLPTGNYVIDEPGYTPGYEQFGTTKPQTESAPEPSAESIKATTAPEPLSVDTSREWLDRLAELEADKEQQFSFEPTESVDASLTPQEAADFLGIKQPASIDDPLGGMDPFEWLENLSREQGLEAPNLLDSSAAVSNLDVAAQPEPEAVITTPEDTLAWLEGLSEEPEPVASSGSGQMPEPVDELGGMSDDPAELQKWLSAQATNLDDVRSFFENAPDGGEAEPIPGEIPSWLLGAQPLDDESADVDAAMLGSAVFKPDEQLPPTPEDFPTWLREERESELDPDFVDFTPTTSSSVSEAPVEAIATAEELQSLVMPDSEEAVDSWAEALDDEFERRQAGDDSIPAWYLEAIARASEEATGPMPAIELTGTKGNVEIVTEPEVEVEPAAQLSASELPDWLSLGDSEDEVVTLTSDNIPDWLQNAKPDDVVPISEDDLAWLSSSQAEPVELPDWLQPMTPVAEVTRQPEPPPPPPVKQPEVKPPEPARAAPPKQAAPAGQRIHVARKLTVEEQVPKALEVYQQLIDDQDGLEDVRADLRELVKTKPKEPRAKRLLGDTHMRLGDLQAALDAYRSALSDL